MITIEERKARARERAKRYYWEHPEKSREISRRHHLKHREERNAYNRQYYRDNLERETARYKAYRQAHKKERDAYAIAWKKAHPDMAKKIHQRWQLKLKTEVLTHYGNGKCRCVKCGESRLACLSLDHIVGGGNKQRKIHGLSGISLYLNLRQNNFSSRDYQTLCMNCQFIKRVENNELQR